MDLFTFWEFRNELNYETDGVGVRIHNSFDENIKRYIFLITFRYSFFIKETVSMKF